MGLILIIFISKLELNSVLIFFNKFFLLRFSLSV